MPIRGIPRVYEKVHHRLSKPPLGCEIQGSGGLLNMMAASGVNAMFLYRSRARGRGKVRLGGKWYMVLRNSQNAPLHGDFAALGVVKAALS